MGNAFIARHRHCQRHGTAQRMANQNWVLHPQRIKCLANHPRLFWQRGKAVILANERAPKSSALFRAFGRAVNSIGGRYVTAEDVGCSVNDMRYVREETEFVSGLPHSEGDAGGDPSPWTAIRPIAWMPPAVSFTLLP